MSKDNYRRRGRREGSRIKIPHDLNAMFPYIMKRRCDSVVYFSELIDLENLLEYIDEKKAAGVNVGFFQLFIAALVKLLRERPGLNRFVKGRRLYQRHDVTVSFVAKRQFEEDAAETNVSLRFKPGDGFEDVLAKLRGEVKIAKSDEVKEDDKVISAIMRLPRFILLFFFKILDFMDFFKGIPKSLEAVDPMRCSVFLANLGSVGIDAPYHHLFEWGTCSIFVTIGRIKKMPYVQEDGTLTVRTMVEIKATLDERIADGFYYARSLDILKSYFENPKCLEEI